MDADVPDIPESGTLTQPETVWAEARRRAAIIGPLAEDAHISALVAAEAGTQLGLTARTVYTLLRRYKASGGSLLSLVPARPTGGRGGSRLTEAVEQVVTSTIAKRYLTRQRVKIETVIKEVRQRCRAVGIPPPAPNTIRARIRRLRPDEVVRTREGRQATRRLEAAGGHFPPVAYPLEVVQIDHTQVDLIVVDPFSREPIGRPWLTLGIDLYSRCITGLCLTLEPPSAVSVGLCLAHGAIEKQAWLQQVGINASWPIQGKPHALHMDNGAEFHSEALRRGCEVHGIQMRYRPPGAPHFGGVIERVMGTFMQMVHELPGTTFSHPRERGQYDAERMASLTLAELERWLVLAITGPYHHALHTGIGDVPLVRWERGVGDHGEPTPIRDPSAFLIDFLPVVRRSIQRHGFVIDHIGYFSNALRPWIAARDHRPQFLIRRDPRDLSRIWVLHPAEQRYLEVPYRTLSHPAITLWEHKHALARLHAVTTAHIDEPAIFRAVQAMRQVAQQAMATSKAARKATARRAHLPTASPPVMSPPTPATAALALSVSVQPFADIEEW